MPVIIRLVLVVPMLFFATAAHAAVWTGLTSNWFNSAAWAFPSGVPGSTDIAELNNAFGGFPLAVTDVALSASTIIEQLLVDTPTTKQYTITGSNGAILTATKQIHFKNADLQALNVHTVSSLGLNTPAVAIFNNAILSLNNSTVTTNSIGTVADGRIDVNNGSSVQTLTYIFDQAAGELRVNSGGELRIAGNTTIVRGTTTINSGGQLNALPGVNLEYSGTALLQFAGSHAVDDGVHLKATGGGDITAGTFIDVGNTAVGSLTVTGAGSTLTAQSSISDWGGGSAGNATVTISNSGVATANQLRAGTLNAVFVGNVTSGGTLRTTSTFLMGGGATVRTVSLDVNGGTLETNGLATFDNRADLNLVNGTVDFKGGATFNAGSRIDWSGGSLNLGASTTLLVDGGVFARTITSGLTFSNSTTTRIQNGGSFTTPSFFDLGTATLDMTGGFMTVGTTGGTISDWGGNGASTTATLTNNAVATYNSGLRMGVLSGGGTTNATISGGARLVSNGSFSAGGSTSSNVTLNVTGGRVESDGSIFLERGATTTVSSAGVIEGQNVVLGSILGTTITSVTGANSLLKSRGTLTAGRTGTSTLTISSGGTVESLGATIIGELAGANASVVVTDSGSKLDVGSSLTIGGSGTGELWISSGGFVAVFGGVTINSASTLDLITGASVETSVGQSLTNDGLISASGGSQIRSDIVSAGRLDLFDASVTRGVTLQANSQTHVDNSTVGSLTHQPTADLHFHLRGLADFDNLAVTGAASLGGDIVVSLIGGFAPTLGTEFQILTASSISGAPTFDFAAAPLTSGLAWFTLQLPTSVSLRIVSAGIEGDYNGDGTVDAADYTVWRNNLGTAFDLNGNGDETDNSLGIVDEADYTWWKQHYGNSNLGPGGGGLTQSMVPEPTTLTMSLMITVVLVLRRQPAIS